MAPRKDGRQVARLLRIPAVVGAGARSRHLYLLLFNGGKGVQGGHASQSARTQDALLLLATLAYENGNREDDAEQYQ